MIPGGSVLSSEATTVSLLPWLSKDSIAGGGRCMIAGERDWNLSSSGASYSASAFVSASALAAVVVSCSPLTWS